METIHSGDAVCSHSLGCTPEERCSAVEAIYFSKKGVLSIAASSTDLSDEVSDVFEMGLIDETGHDIPADARALLKPRNVIHLALVVVQMLANEQLWTHTGPPYFTAPEPPLDLRSKNCRKQITPQNCPEEPHGAMWLQYARSIDGNKNYRQCRQCGKWFEISLEANRPTRLFCKDACRYKFYRERIATAQELHLEGVSIEAITQRLETDTATVEGWIARPAPRKHKR